MNKVKVFELEESAYQTGKYVIRFHPELFCCESTEGSYALMAARLMGLSYANFCRFCRDNIQAEIIGKGHKYPVIYFKKNQESLMLVRLLNTRANLVLWEKNNPDWKEHQEFLAEKAKAREERFNVSKT